MSELDKLAHVRRQTRLSDGSRRENAAGHSWQLAVSAMFFAEYAQQELDLCNLIRMILVHELVEIDAGDTFSYDEEARSASSSRPVHSILAG